MYRTVVAFRDIKALSCTRLPWLRRAKVRFCAEADASHRKSWRLFCHSCHYPDTVCWARAAETELSDRELRGVTAHEFGHIVGTALRFPEHMKQQKGDATPWRVQAEADWIARRVLGFRIRYNKRTLQELL